MTHRAKTIFEGHRRCPTPRDCVCACPACLNARANAIEKDHYAQNVRAANEKEAQP